MRGLCGALALGAAAVALAGSTPAGAAIFVKSLAGAPDPGAAGNRVITFDDPLPAGVSFAPGSQYSILQGLVAHVGYNPAGDATYYLSVPGAAAAGTIGSATLDFTPAAGRVSDFSFYWGSIDRANDLTITTTMGSLHLTGADVIATGFGSATSARGNRRVFFALGSGEMLTSIRFRSPTAFELDDIVMTMLPPLPGAVPEPASWAMMLGGFGAIGGLARRRRGGAAADAPRRRARGIV